MGPSMMDFFVRETRAVVKGPMAIVRFGTCGGLVSSASAGVVAVATKGSGFVTRDPNAFAYNYGNDNGNDDSYTKKYIMSKIAPSEDSLSSLVVSQLKDAVGEAAVIEGANVTAESFYSSQG
jgi:uridine phosphorylase